MTELANDSDIIFLQETWLDEYDKEIETLKRINKDFSMYFKSMYFKSRADELRNGRPYGRIAQIIKKKTKLKFKITHYSKRISVCEINNSHTIIGMYAKANNNTEAGKLVQQEDILKVLSLIDDALNKQQNPIVR